jgi:hypothetical protein
MSGEALCPVGPGAKQAFQPTLLGLEVTTSLRPSAPMHALLRPQARRLRAGYCSYLHLSTNTFRSGSNDVIETFCPHARTPQTASSQTSCWLLFLPTGFKLSCRHNPSFHLPSNIPFSSLPLIPNSLPVRSYHLYLCEIVCQRPRGKAT